MTGNYQRSLHNYLFSAGWENNNYGYWNNNEEGVYEEIDNIGRLPLFFLASCHSGEYDVIIENQAQSPNRRYDCLAEQYTIKDDKGAIASIAPVRFSNVNISELAVYFSEMIFNIEPAPTNSNFYEMIGWSLMSGKNIGGVGKTLFMLFGDPALNLIQLPPSVPQNLELCNLNNQAYLVWDDNPEYNIDYYKIYRMLDPDPFHPEDPRPCWYHLDNSAGRECEYTDPDFSPNPNGGSTGSYKIKAVNFAGQASSFSAVVSSDGYIRIMSENDSLTATLPDKFQFRNTFPNPFNAETTISFSLPSQSKIEVSIYNIEGKLVETLFSGMKTAGVHSYNWNAGDIASGIYLCRIELQSAGTVQHSDAVQKLLLLK